MRVRIGMDRSAAQSGEQSLSVHLNRGAATVVSPPLTVHAEFSYLLKAHIKTVGLEHNKATVSVTFYDATGNVVEQFEQNHLATPPIGGNCNWDRSRTQSDKVRQAVIGLHVHPGNKADLNGSVFFDSVWLGRLPRMSFSSDRSYNVYTINEQPELNCEVSGIFDNNPVVHFELFDIDGKVVLTQTEHLAAEKTAKEDELENEEALSQSGYRCEPNGVLARPTQARLLPAAPRFRGKAAPYSAQLTMALIVPGSLSPSGEFGWSLPRGDDPLSLSSLEKLLPNMGINWVKLPLWVTDNEQLDRLVTFAERMSHRGIETVGLLTNPPESARAKFGNVEQLSAADIFSTEPGLVVSVVGAGNGAGRLSLQVRWWQLGNDNDVSFVGYRRLLPTLAGVKAQLQRFGQEIHLGLGWRIFDEPVPIQKMRHGIFYRSRRNRKLPPPNFLRTCRNSIRKKPRRWISLEPLHVEHYSLETRTNDLVHRMLSAKMAGAEAIFLNDPFHPHRGIMRPRGHSRRVATDEAMEWPKIRGMAA